MHLSLARMYDGYQVLKKYFCYNFFLINWCQNFGGTESDKRETETSYSEEEKDLDHEKVNLTGDISSDNNHDAVRADKVRTSKVGVKRKHHRAWTLCEVLKLVEGVARYGAGRWSEIRRVAFASYAYRTSVDLKVISL